MFDVANIKSYKFEKTPLHLIPESYSKHKFMRMFFYLLFSFWDKCCKIDCSNESKMFKY